MGEKTDEMYEDPDSEQLTQSSSISTCKLNQLGTRHINPMFSNNLWGQSHNSTGWVFTKVLKNTRDVEQLSKEIKRWDYSLISILREIQNSNSDYHDKLIKISLAKFCFELAILILLFLQLYVLCYY